jgi:hypothetical protein
MDDRFGFGMFVEVIQGKNPARIIRGEGTIFSDLPEMRILKGGKND